MDDTVKGTRRIAILTIAFHRHCAVIRYNDKNSDFTTLRLRRRQMFNLQVRLEAYVSHAQETIEFLSLSLSPYLALSPAPGDRAHIYEKIVNARI